MPARASPQPDGKRGLRALQPRRHGPQTSDGKATAPVRDLLADRPLPNRTNAVWTGDMVAGEALGGRGECRVWRASGYLACWGLCFRVGVMKIGMLVKEMYFNV